MALKPYRLGNSGKFGECQIIEAEMEIANTLKESVFSTRRSVNGRRPGRFGSMLGGRLWIVGLLLALALTAAALGGGLASAQTVATVDYDSDNDGLIEVSSLAQLNAIRWDLNGNGTASSGNETGYTNAFPDAATGMGCPAGGCTGYELTADLDFDTDGNGEANSGDAYWNGGKGWDPLAPAGYTGVFEGNGHTISNLYINRSAAQEVGLFAKLGEGGVIRNLGLPAADVTSTSTDQQSSAGALAGRNHARIEASYATGSVSGAQWAGGLVGRNHRGSGITGANLGMIAASYATGSVSNASMAGGLVGYNFNGSIISSYATGTVSRGASASLGYAGGLNGFNAAEGRIVASYATGGVTGSGSHDYAGGLVGRNLGSIAASYSTGAVSNSANAGGLVGSNDTAATVTDGYWDTTTSGVTTSDGGTGQTTAQLQAPTGYDGIYANWRVDLDNADGDNNIATGGDDPWDFLHSTQYPRLSWERVVALVDYDEDDDGLIEVSSLAQLNAIRMDVEGDGAVSSADETGYTNAFPNAATGMGCPPVVNREGGCQGYELAADLDFDTNGDGVANSGDDYWNGGKGWDPLAPAGYTGVFEGNGQSISNLYINRSDTQSVGLFNKVGSTGVIRNVALLNADVTSTYRQSPATGTLAGTNQGSVAGSFATGSVGGSAGFGGGFVGDNSGVISDSYASTSVSGSSFSGGLVGESTGTISNSYATGVVGGSINAGGLAGSVSAGTITASYATGDAGGANVSGGLAGLVSNSSITASYATGAVSGIYDGGGLAGIVTNGSITASYATGAVRAGDLSSGGLLGLMQGSSTITDSYWDTTTSGQTASAGGAGKTTSELQSPTGYDGIYANWNLDLDNADGDNNIATGGDDPWDFLHSTQYPRLSWERVVALVDYVDYDDDDDGLIEVSSLAQLNAIRWDLDGDGAADDTANTDAYETAFPDAASGMGCPPVVNNAGGCTGYELTVDLDFDTNGNKVADSGDDFWNTGNGWTAIGDRDSNNGFYGTLEGNQHSISNLHSTAGLFGYVERLGVVRNLALVNVDIDSSGQAGALAAVNYGLISAVSVDGRVTSANSTKGHTGMLVGFHEGTIIGSYAAGKVTGHHAVGGLIGGGSNNKLGGLGNGAIIASYSAARVTGKGNAAVAGGLAGQIAVTTFSFGYAEGSIVDSYWDTDASRQAASAAGLGKTTTELLSPTGYRGIYANWNVDLDNADSDDNTATGGDSHWQFGTASEYPRFSWQTVSAAVPGVDYDSDDDGLIDVSSLARLNAIRWDADGDGAAARADEAGYDNAFPNAAAGMGCPPVVGDTGGCQGYELTAALDFDENDDGEITSADATWWNGGEGWDPLTPAGYTGVFEGNGHTISNLYINRSLTHTGLFAQLGAGGVIRNVGLLTAGVTSSADATESVAGALAGSNKGNIIGAHASGAVTSSANYTGGMVGNNRGSVTNSNAFVALTATIPAAPTRRVIMGGLVGINHGTISASYAGGPLSGAGIQFGGLAGRNPGAITASFATGAVSGSGTGSIAGGLVGKLTGSIAASYSTSVVSGADTTGGLVGTSVLEATVTDSYWDTTTSGQTTSPGGAGKTTAELRSPTGYTGIYANWNVDLDNADDDNNIATGGDSPWNFLTASQYPRLSWETVSVTVTDYDSDDDGLIDVSSLAQLNAIHWDLDGNGAPDSAYVATLYAATYPDSAAGMGCPPVVGDTGGCIGYELTADLDFDENGDGEITSADAAWWDDGKGWAPLGYTSYTGVFEGNGHTISNLFINRSGLENIGLFGWLGSGGTIRNVGLSGVNVTSGRSGDSTTAAALAGRNEGVITGSHAAGAVNGSAKHTGGLVGDNRGTVQDSYASAAVSGTGGNTIASRVHVGGLVGKLTSGSIKNSYATGAVSGRNVDIGGLVGYMDASDVFASYATGSVTAEDGTVVLIGTRAGADSGGLVGSLASGSHIVASYATGAVHGVNVNVGGLVGTVFSGNYVVASYATGAVSGQGSRLGGLVGRGNTGATITDSYWDTATSGRTSSAGGTGQTTHQLQSPPGYTGIYANWNLDLDNADGDDNIATGVDDPWRFLADLDYPRLWWEGVQADYDVDDDGLIEVDTLVKLDAIHWDLDGNGAADSATRTDSYAEGFPNAPAGMGCPDTGCVGYELTADLDFDTNGDGVANSGDDFWRDGIGWEPLAAAGYTGVFEGNGHTVSNLYINREWAHAGLFAKLGSGGIIRNVGLLNADITSKGNVITNAGALAGENNGRIESAYATGSIYSKITGGLVGKNTGTVADSHSSVRVRGTSEVGGLVSENSGTIQGSYATGTVSGSLNVSGGLVGDNSGSIIASYATGSIVDQSTSGLRDKAYYSGGLAGRNSGAIIASYATGTALGGARSGGLVGSGYHGTVTDSYWNTTTSGLTTSEGGTGQTTAQLQAPRGYTGIYANWNVDLDNADGDDNIGTGGDDPWNFLTASLYPQLRWEEVKADYDVDDDGLIEVDTLVKLDAIHWDLDGNGAADSATRTDSYAEGFPNAPAGMGCPDTGCVGYELTADLDFDTDGSGGAASGDDFWRDGIGWEPLAAAGYTGVFEGNGHTISNLYINRELGHIGLFAKLNAGGVIRNVGLPNVDITSTTGYSTVAGALVGENNGRIESAYAAGSIYSKSTGGLVGKNTGVVADSHSSVTVRGKGEVGGLVSENSGTIQGSYATGTVSSGFNYVGGLVASNTGSIIASYATGSTVSFQDGFIEFALNAGGLAGVNSGSITASYATGSVRGGAAAGGLVGVNSGAITASYTTGTASSVAAGGLSAHNTGSVTDSYWDTTASGLTASDGGAGKTTSELQSPTGYTGIYANWNVDLDNADGDDNVATGGDDPWNFLTDIHYPELSWEDVAALPEPEPTTITLSADPATLAKDAQATAVTVTAALNGTALDQDITLEISLDGTATHTEDYTHMVTSLSITAGSLSGTATLTINPVDDAVVEGHETIIVNGKAEGLTVLPVSIALPDNDTANLAVSGPARAVPERGSAVFTVTLSHQVDAEVSVAWAVSPGTATAEDYHPHSGTVSFAAGSPANSRHNVIVNRQEDQLAEPEESFSLALGTVTSALADRVTVASPPATATLAASDPVKVAVFGPAAVKAGDAATYTISLVGGVASAPLTVEYATADGTASAGEGTAYADEQYTAASGTLTFPAGSAAAQTVTVQTIKDTGGDIGYGFTFAISNAAGGGGPAPDIVVASVTTIISGQGPQFNQDSYSFRLNEGRGKGWKKTHVKAAAGNGGKVTYSLSGYNPPCPGCAKLATSHYNNQLFRISKNSGAIVYQGPGEYHECFPAGQAKYELAVTATDSQGNSSTVPVIINIRNLNDAPCPVPRFSEPEHGYHFLLPEGQGSGWQAKGVKAVGRFGGKVTYSLHGDNPLCPGCVAIENSDYNDRLFRINPETGRITYQGKGEDYESFPEGQARYELEVRATDDWSNSSTAPVTVYIQDLEDK